jgi:NB-ARC domain
VDNQEDKWQLCKEVFLNSLAEICSLDGETIGVGCFATPSKILTCLHPFEKMDVSRLEITSTNGEKRRHKVSHTATHENTYPDIDLLVIEVEVDSYKKGACVELDLELDIRASNSFGIYHPFSGLIPIDLLSSSSPQELKFSSVAQEGVNLVGCPIVNLTTGKVRGIVSVIHNSSTSSSSQMVGWVIPIKEVTSKLPDVAAGNQYITNVRCNLPERKQQELIVRKDELQILLKYLSPQHTQHIVEINGVGGIGKTELAVIAANKCLLSYQRVRSKSIAPIFDAVIFVSLGSNSRNVSLNYPDAGLLRVLGTIGDTLKIPSFNPYTEVKDFSRVYEALSRKTTLLILDGWDDSINVGRIWDFLDNVPYPTKVVVTARERKSSYSCILLKPLTPEQSRDFILQQALPEALNSDEAAVLKSAPRVPSVLLRAIAQVRAGQYEEDREFDLGAASDPAIFDINRSIDSITGTIDAAILNILSLFATSASIHATVDISSRLLASKQAIELDDALQRLEQLQLISKFKSVGGESHYRLLPNVRECISDRSDLSNRPEDREVRLRWVKWYCGFAQSALTNQLEEEWENIKEVLTWCQNERDFNSIRTMWLCLDEFTKRKRDWAINFYWWEYLEKGFSQSGETLLNMKALLALTHACLEMGNDQLAQKYLDEASKLLQEEPYEIKKASKYEEYLVIINEEKTKIPLSLA